MYLILGLGKSGVSIKRYFDKYHIPYQIHDDKKNIINKSLDNIKCIIKSPGVPNNHKILLEALEKHILIKTDLELLETFKKDKKAIVITGTNGKSTTVSLLKEILNGWTLCGNIGNPIFDYLEDNKFIIEVSSYMGEYCCNFKSNISCLLNIFPNHLDHHKSLDNYIRAKMNIIRSAKDYIVYNYDDLYSSEISKLKINKISFSTKSYNADVYLLNNNIYYKERFIFSCKDLTPYLRAYIEDVLAVIAIIKALEKIEKKEYLIDKIFSYKGLPHRLELCYDKNIKIYNDSKSTNFLALNKAIDALPEERILLICGGSFRNDNLKAITKHPNLKKVYIYGENKMFLKSRFEELNIESHTFETLREVIDEIKQNKSQDNITTILFSPGSQSFDQYPNFEARGEEFKNLLKEF